MSKIPATRTNPVDPARVSHAVCVSTSGRRAEPEWIGHPGVRDLIRLPEDRSIETEREVMLRGIAVI
jgi:hypothetical protein